MTLFRRNKRPGWVYLMEVERNGYVKIGFSVEPQVRERTLQSEQPRISLIDAWKARPADKARLHSQAM